MGVEWWVEDHTNERIFILGKGLPLVELEDDVIAPPRLARLMAERMTESVKGAKGIEKEFLPKDFVGLATRLWVFCRRARWNVRVRCEGYIEVGEEVDRPRPNWPVVGSRYDEEEPTLERLVGICRGGPRERKLVCPSCAGDVELLDGLYSCVVCARAFVNLAELLAVP